MGTSPCCGAFEPERGGGAQIKKKLYIKGPERGQFTWTRNVPLIGLGGEEERGGDRETLLEGDDGSACATAADAGATLMTDCGARADADGTTMGAEVMGRGADDVVTTTTGEDAVNDVDVDEDDDAVEEVAGEAKDICATGGICCGCVRGGNDEACCCCLAPPADSSSCALLLLVGASSVSGTAACVPLRVGWVIR